MKRFSLRLSDEELVKVTEYAEKTEQSINDVIRQIIRQWKPKPWLATPLRFVAALSFPTPLRGRV